MSTIRLKRTIHHSIPPSTDRNYQLGDVDVIWKEKFVNNRIRKWLGPYSVANTDIPKNLLLFEVRKGEPPTPYSIVKLKTYYSPYILSCLFLSYIQEGLAKFKSPVNYDSILLTEILDVSDQNNLSEEAAKAEIEGVLGLLKRRTFKGVFKEDVIQDGISNQYCLSSLLTQLSIDPQSSIRYRWAPIKAQKPHVAYN